MPYVEWTFKLDYKIGIQCLKKLNPGVETPFKSTELLHFIKKGGYKAVIEYLECLCFEYKLKEKLFHTELGCLYAQSISEHLKNYRSTSEEGG